jgi:hypothetical protein
VVNIPAKTAKIAKINGYVPSRFANSTTGISQKENVEESDKVSNKTNAPITSAESADDRSKTIITI